MKSTRCPHCKEKLLEGQRIHAECVEGWWTAQTAKRKAQAERAAAKRRKVDRQTDRARRRALVPTSALEQECRRIVQKIARLRDRWQGCISCDKPANWDGQWHGSHFRSVGACSALSLHLWNINRACWICNKLYSGRIDQYELGLIERYGQERVDWLRSQNKVMKRSRDYLERFKTVMGKRLRRMEKRHEKG